MQHGVLCVIGVLAGDLLGEGKGEAENSRHECAKLLEAALIERKRKNTSQCDCMSHRVHSNYTFNNLFCDGREPSRAKKPCRTKQRCVMSIFV